MPILVGTGSQGDSGQVMLTINSSSSVGVIQVAGTESRFIMTDNDASSGNKVRRFTVADGILKYEAINDAYSAIDSTPLTILANGNVGIGTTAPTHALNVVGDINATGAIYKNGGTALDYVFDKYYDGEVKEEDAINAENYTFIPLDELELYLEQNRHLSRLPGSLIANPYEIGQVDELYLEKIEESHIYIIELNKKLKKLEAEIEKLKEEAQNNPKEKK